MLQRAGVGIKEKIRLGLQRTCRRDWRRDLARDDLGLIPVRFAALMTAPAG